MLRRDRQLRIALASRDVDIDAAEAFERLKRISQDANTTIAQVAQQVTGKQLTCEEVCDGYTVAPINDSHVLTRARPGPDGRRRRVTTLCRNALQRRRCAVGRHFARCWRILR
jgi:hypothetical protein